MRIIIGDSSPPSESTMSSFGSVEEIVDVADGILGEGLVDDVLEGSVLVAARCGAFEVPARDGDVGDGARALARAHPRWCGVNADLDVVLDVRRVGLGESRHAGVEGDGRAFVTVDEAIRVEDTPEVIEGLLAPDFAPGAGREILRRRELTHDPFRGTFLNQGPPKRGAVEKGRHAWTRYAGEMDARRVRLILRGGEKSVRKRRRRREHARVRTGRGMCFEKARQVHVRFVPFRSLTRGVSDDGRDVRRTWERFEESNDTSLGRGTDSRMNANTTLVRRFTAPERMVKSSGRTFQRSVSRESRAKSRTAICTLKNAEGSQSGDISKNLFTQNFL